MNRLWTTIALCGLALGCAVSIQRGLDQGRTSETTVGTITPVTDGDTVHVNDQNGRDLGRIRLLGINAPELAHDGAGAQCWAEQSRARLAQLTPISVTVRLVPDPTQGDRDTHWRLLRYLLVDDVDVQEVLLAEGHATAFWPKGPGLHAGNYLQAVQHAEHDQRGLWAACPNGKDA